jgi:hypothetical protein
MSNIWNTILEKRNSIEKNDNLPQLTLDEFSKRNMGIEIYSEVVGGNIWFCCDSAMANQIRKENPSTITYTVDELRHLLSLNPTPEEIKKLNLVKEEFSNSKIIGSNQNEKIINKTVFTASAKSN